MSQIQYADELIREYFIFRGFSNTLKTFDAELKLDKDKSFRVDKIVDQLMQFILAYDLTSLRELWSHLDSKVFSKLEHEFSSAVRKLESALLKLYLINAVSNGKMDKVNEFFTKMTAELQGQPEWKEWFMLPFFKNAEESPTFAVHFTRSWQDTLLVSLHNFLSIVFQMMPLPVLVSYEEEALRIKQLQDENEYLKQRLAALLQTKERVGLPSAPEVPCAPDIMDDFYSIAQESSGPLSTYSGSCNESHSKSLKQLIRTIGGGNSTSPIMGRKPCSSSIPGSDPASKRSSSKQRLSSTPGSWMKPVGGGSNSSDSSNTTSKRSASLDARSRIRGSGSVRDNSLDNLDRRPVKQSNRHDNYLLLSQEEMNEHHAAVTQCRFSACGSIVASSDNDGVIKIWSPAPAPKMLSVSTMKSSVTSLAWVTRNERYFLSGTKNGIIRLHDSKESKVIWDTTNDKTFMKDGRIISLCCSPSDSTFVCACVSNQNQGKLVLFDIKTRKPERTLSLGLGGANLVANCCTYNHNGQLLIVGCSDGTVRTIDVRNSECINSWSVHLGAVHCLQLTPDHNYCYSLGADNKLCRHSLTQSATPLWEAALSETPVTTSSMPLTQSFCLDQSGNHILVCSSHSTANIHQITSSGLSGVVQLGGHSSPTVVCDWSNGSQCGTCVTATVDGKIKVSTLLMP
ncbi:hypothetical protein LSTR_LSTR004291 [Laodelphax striatellus]|uniref:WD repeat-containing protein 91 n=1 Tax=Laodelphax striatellus TaxID=195883 RepID=A0A482WHU5_LAOST|nr:hypothetical protein LSTR_LSTR004291 [Laodelphax striatellus]